MKCLLKVSGSTGLPNWAFWTALIKLKDDYENMKKNLERWDLKPYNWEDYWIKMIRVLAQCMMLWERHRSRAGTNFGTPRFFKLRMLIWALVTIQCLWAWSDKMTGGEWWKEEYIRNTSWFQHFRLLNHWHKNRVLSQNVPRGRMSQNEGTQRNTFLVFGWSVSAIYIKYWSWGVWGSRFKVCHCFHPKHCTEAGLYSSLSSAQGRAACLNILLVLCFASVSQSIHQLNLVSFLMDRWKPPGGANRRGLTFSATSSPPLASPTLRS